MNRPDDAQLMGNDPSYKLPLILAIGLHILLGFALFFQLASTTVSQLQVQPDVDIIKAVAVNPPAAQLAETNAKTQEKIAAAQADLLKQQQADEAAKLAEQQAQNNLAEQQAQQQAQAAAQKAQAAAAQQQANELAQQKIAIQQAHEKAEQQQKQQAQAHAAQVAAAQHAQQKAAALKQQQAAKAKQAAAAKAKAQKQQEAAQQLKIAQQKELDAQISKEQNELAAAKSQTQQTEIDKYKALIEQSISQNWVVPGGANPDLSCELLIEVGPGGAVMNVQISRSSGDLGLDNSARTAVFKASPLPVPDDPALFDQFRKLRLTVKPENVQ